ncbi:MAG: M15 family metallopeptidase [Candidatus Gracilibacteria bacterium]|jgi:D-alanyl-D-alanine dipeptidase
MTLIDYTKIEIRENGEEMVDLATLGFLLQPTYFEQGLAPDPRIFLRKATAEKLLAAQASLPAGLRFKVWDAYRSRDVQNNVYQRYWQDLQAQHPDWDEEKIKLEVGKFVTPPYLKEKVPPHATGGTVDLTIVDADGKELDMGTEYDFFGAEAAPFFYEIYKTKPAVTTNRRILRSVMEAQGFTLEQDEWWHFDYGNQIWALKSGKPFAIYGEAKLA